MKNVVLVSSLLFVGLMSGLFFSWSVSVMPGLKRLPDREFILAMQSMNRAIQNPLFFLVFFGAMVLLFADCVLFYERGSMHFYWLLAAIAAYLAGVLGITIVGNVPLNNALDAFQTEGATTAAMQQLRYSFERRWNFLNDLRTVFNLLSFACLVMAVFGVNKNRLL